MVKKLLIVEDDDALRDILKARFESDYDIQVASDGEQALEICQSEKPDALLLDIQIPKKDAGLVCSRIRSYPVFGHPVIIIISGMPASDDIQEQWRTTYQVDDFFTKPLEMDQLERRLSACLEGD